MGTAATPTTAAATATAPARRRARVPVDAVEKRAAGAIIGALLDAITFGALEASPQSRA